MFVPRGVPHPPDQVLRALALRKAGRSIPSIAAECDLPQGTVSRWCRGLLPADAVLLQDTGVVRPRCERCGRDAHDDLPKADYSYLLGIYLGDGCLGPAGRSVALRIVMDAAYPGIIEEVGAAILTVRGAGTVSRYRPRDERCVVLTSYTRAWKCLFPQHGVGPKHLRPIVLEPWQQSIVQRQPGRFARGLIHSDGWRGVNRVRVKGRDYAYPRYQFSNRSSDIRRLFTDALDELGVEWRPWGRFHVSVARRRAVALLDAHVGPKA
jgi:hypothetical protein